MLIFIFWIIFIISHLVFLTSLPIFEDEAIYLYLADKIPENPLQFLFVYASSYGLLPMFGWLVSVFKLFLQDSLIAGRVLNVLLASTLIFWVVKIAQLFKMNKFFTFSAIILLIISPIIHLNSRVALLDTSILVFTAWYIYFTLKYLKERKFKDIFFLFFSVLAAILTKPTAVFGLIPVIYLLFLCYTKNKKRLLSGLIYITPAYLIPFIFMGLIIVIFGSQILGDSGSSLIFHQPLRDIMAKIKINIFLTSIWSKTYYLPFLLLPVFFIIFHKFIKNRNFYLLMVIWLISSVIFMITLNRFYYPRHILILSLPLIAIASAFLSEIPRKSATVIFLLLSLTKIQLGWDIITSISNAEIALEDKFEYFENYTSGQNINLISDYINELSYNQPITVWLDGSYVMEYGLRRATKNTNVIFKSFRLDDNLLQHSPGTVFKDTGRKTYVIVNRWEPINSQSLKLIKSFPVSFRHSQHLYLLP